MRLPERRHAIRHDRIRRQRRQSRPGNDDPQIGARLVHVHARLGTERDSGRVREPIDEPALAEVVVDDQQSVGLQPVPHRTERFLGEHVALEADA